MFRVLALLIVLAAASPGAATMLPCGRRDEVVATVERIYGEVPAAMGLASNGAVIEVLVSDTGSFTMILTRPDGISCLMAAGENWENLPTKRKGI